MIMVLTFNAYKFPYFRCVAGWFRLNKTVNGREIATEPIESTFDEVLKVAIVMQVNSYVRNGKKTYWN